MGEKLLLMLLSPLPVALQKLFFPYFPRNSNYLLLGEWAGLRIDNPITFPTLAPIYLYCVSPESSHLKKLNPKISRVLS